MTCAGCGQRYPARDHGRRLAGASAFCPACWARIPAWLQRIYQLGQREIGRVQGFRSDRTAVLQACVEACR